MILENIVFVYFRGIYYTLVALEWVYDLFMIC